MATLTTKDRVESLETLYLQREEKLAELIGPMAEFYEIELQIRTAEHSLVQLVGITHSNGRKSIQAMGARIPEKRSDFAFNPTTGAEKLAVTACKAISIGLVYEHGIHIGDFRKLEFNYD